LSAGQPRPQQTKFIYQVLCDRGLVNLEPWQVPGKEDALPCVQRRSLEEGAETTCAGWIKLLPM
jgi:hypothetical protein